MKFKTAVEWAEYFKGKEVNPGMFLMVMQDAMDEISAKYEKRIAEIYAHHEKQKELWFAAIDRRDAELDQLYIDMKGDDE